MRIPILSRLRARRASALPVAHLNDPVLRARLKAAVNTALAGQSVEVDVVTDPEGPCTTETVYLSWRREDDVLLRLTMWADGYLDWQVFVEPNGPSLFTESDDPLVQWIPGEGFSKAREFLGFVEGIE